MRFLFFGLLGMFSPLGFTGPVLEASDKDRLELATSFQQLDSDIIDFDLSGLENYSDDIFSPTNANLDFEYLSSRPIAYFDGLSSDPPLLESQLTLFENSGPDAYPDISFSNLANYEDGSYDTSFAGSLVTNVAAVAPKAPSCSSLPLGPSKIAFQLLCCETPCTQDQSWRRSCDHWDSTCPLDQVVCCQQFNDGWEFNWKGFDCAMASGSTFTEPDWNLVATGQKCFI